MSAALQSGSSVRVRGLSAIRAGLRATGLDVETRLGQIVAEAALRVEGTAKTLAPVDTGFHRANIRADVSEALTRFASRVTAGASYAAALEFGTRHMAARPALIPALESVAPWLYSEVRALVAGAASSRRRAAA